ncbi:MULTISPECIES: hypothetical protein [unclassified Providencia]|uniref:hypothetical protein n=1 Tax=unclassified Providencia TaxID=2633465 RepID=UPI00234A82B0|nr:MULTISPECIES: hypothetical protein [unclassified Providencia]
MINSQKIASQIIGPVLTFFLFFMLLSGPRLKLPDLNITFSILLAGLCILFLVFKRKINKSIFRILIILIISLSLSLFSLIYNNVDSFSTIEYFLKMILWFFASYFIVALYNICYKDKVYEKLSFHIQYIYFINATFVICVMFIPQIKNLATTYLSNNENMTWLINKSIRSTDLVMGGGALTSIVFSVIFIMALCSLIYTRKKIFLCFIIVYTAAIIFTGRTGLILIILFIAPILIMINYSKNKRIFSFKIILTSLGFFIIIPILMYLIFLFFQLMLPNVMDEIEKSSLTWSLELVRNLLSSGKFETESTTDLANMYSHVSPLDVFSFFGSGLDGRDRDVFYLNTDVGYIRALFSFGFFGMIFIFAKYIYIFINSVSHFITCENNYFKFTIIISLSYYSLSILIVNFKEFHEAVRSGFPLLMTLFISLNYNKKYKSEGL